MPEKILIVTDDAGESFETLYAQHRFREAGYEPVIAATEKKRLNGVIHDFYPGWNTYIEKPGYLIQSDITFDEVNVEEYEAMLLIGGRAPEFLRHNKTLIEIVAETDPQTFAVDTDHLAWRDFTATAEQVSDARAAVLTSFGSCSFSEPRDDLRNLGFVEEGAHFE